MNTDILDQIAKQDEEFELGLMDYEALLAYISEQVGINPVHTTIQTVCEDIFLIYPRMEAGYRGGPVVLYFHGEKYALLEQVSVDRFGKWLYLTLDANRLNAICNKGAGTMVRALTGKADLKLPARPEESLVGMLAMAKLLTS
jgi:hypothetical protein